MPKAEPEIASVLLGIEGGDNLGQGDQDAPSGAVILSGGVTEAVSVEPGDRIVAVGSQISITRSSWPCARFVGESR